MDIQSLRPPLPLDYAELDWSDSEGAGEAVELSDLRPPLKKRNPRLKVWFEPGYRRRMMTEEELAANSELFEAIDRERRSAKIEVVLVAVVLLLLFSILLTLFYSGVIPFCNV